MNDKRKTAYAFVGVQISMEFKNSKSHQQTDTLLTSVHGQISPESCI